MTLDKAHRG